MKANSRVAPQAEAVLERIRALAPRIDKLHAEISLAPVRAYLRGDALDPERQSLSARELAHSVVLQKLSELIPCPAILCKGEALARSLYGPPALRWRTDIDLWVRADERALVEQALRAAGGITTASACGRWIIPERVYRISAGRLMVNVDLHWQILSRPSLLPSFPFASIYQEASALDAGQIRIPSLSDSLLHACAHRRAHHRLDGDRAIWLLDIDLLWHALSAPERAALILRAKARGLGTLLRCGLMAASGLTGMELASEHFQELSKLEHAEVSARLADHAPTISDLRFDLASTRGSQRLQVLKDYLFPPWSYMRERHPATPDALLPLRYLSRIAGGVMR